MARYRSSFRPSGAGSTTLPFASLYAVANVRLLLREVWCFNTTAVGLVVALHRFTTAGTPGTGQTEAKHDGDTPAAQGTVFDLHTGTPPTLGDQLGRAPLAAAIGAGVVWTFDDEPIRIPPGTANGVGILVATGTGQVCDVTFVWDE
jgi:hypothetical protein